MTIREALIAAYAERWDDAASLMRAAADAGDEAARAQIEVLGEAKLDDLIEPPPMERLHEKASIFVCRGFAPPAICDWLVARALPRLERSYVHNAKIGRLEEDASRTATTCGVEIDFITAIMQTRAARRTRVPVINHERPTVISYEVGQKFEHHYDFINPEMKGAMTELVTMGQRTITIVTYLNTEFEGAHTDFPLLGIEFKGGKGDAIVFSNVLADGQPDRSTLHAGLPPTTGRKWVLSQWIRNRPVPRG